MEIFKKIVELSKTNIKFAIVTVVEKKGSGPRGPGARMVVLENGKTYGTVGGGQLENDAAIMAVEAIKNGKPELRKFNLLKDVNSICGGEMTMFIEPFEKKSSLYLFGGGHCALAFYNIAKNCDLNIHIVEDRKEMLVEERFPGAVLHYAENQSEFIAENKMNICNNDMVLIFTRSHDIDYIVMKELLKQDLEFSYFGIIGSKSKLTTNFGKILSEGIKREKLEMINAPVGLDTGGESPEEIAVSILAEVLIKKYGRTGKHLKDITEIEY